MNAIFIAAVTSFVWSLPLAAIVWISLRIARNTLNAATRYGIWWAALAVVTALPVINLPSHPNPIITQRGAKASALLPGFGPALANPEPMLDHPVDPPKTVRAPIAIHQTEWPKRFAQLWAVASLLMLARLAFSLVMLHIQRREAIDAPIALAALMTRCLARSGVKRRARIAIVNKVGSPLVAGPIRPCILIPSQLLQAIDDAEMEQICLHEAAHLARFDDCALLLQRIFEALAVFHPVVRWIARQIDLEREIACDDYVIALTGDSRSYASCLTHVAELSNGYRSSPAAAAAADESSHLNRRIDMLLNKTRRTGTKVLKIRFATALTALALLAGLIGKSPSLLAIAAPPAPVLQSAQIPPIQHAQPQPDEPRASTPTRSAAHMVSIPVTVTDPLNRFVTGLDKNSFLIYEDGVQQAISSLRAPDSNVSLTVVSNGEGDRSAMDGAIAELEKELAHLRRTYTDSYPDVALLKDKLARLNGERWSSLNSLQERVVALEQELNRLNNEGSDLETFRRRELEALRREIDLRERSAPTSLAGNQPSSLLSRLSAAIDSALASPETGHAIVVEFDARDKSIHWPENELHALIQRSTVRVYAIGVRTPGETHQSEPAAFLSLLTNATGGRHFEAANPAEVPEIEKKIEIELQNEYTATYLPGNRSASGTYHRIEVQMAPVRGLPALHAYTRPGYYTTSP